MNNSSQFSNMPPVPQNQSEFDTRYDNVNGRIPQQFDADLEGVPVDMIDKSHYVLSDVLAVLVILVSFLGLGSAFILDYFKSIGSPDAGVAIPDEYQVFISQIIDFVPIKGLTLILLGVFVLIGKMLFSRIGKVKFWYAISPVGIYVHQHSHTDVLTWDLFEPLVKVSGVGKNASVILRYKPTMQDLIDSTVRNIGTNAGRSISNAQTFGKGFSVGRGISFGSGSGRSNTNHHVRYFKLTGVSNPNKVSDLIKKYLVQENL